jgi:hypothetical protein
MVEENNGKWKIMIIICTLQIDHNYAPKEIVFENNSNNNFIP